MRDLRLIGCLEAGIFFSSTSDRTSLWKRAHALALRKFFSTGLTFSASAITLAPSSPMKLWPNPRVVRTLLKTPNPVAS